MRTCSKLGVISLFILCSGPVVAQTATEKTADKAHRAVDKAAAATERAAAATERAGEKVADKVERGTRRVEGEAGDSWLTAKTKLALYADSRVNGGQVNVETKGAVITLRGKVDSEAAKLAAAEVAHTIDGVKDVKNELQIVAAAQRKIVEAKDDAIVSTVKERLGKDRRFKDAKLDVRSDAGVVTLSGEAPNLLTCVSASEVAFAVAGVRSVKNTVAVKPGL